MKRRRIQPNPLALDWRDPDMPVLRLGYKDKVVVVYEVDPDKIKQYYAQKMLFHPAPSWDEDETYDLRKHKGDT